MAKHCTEIFRQNQIIRQADFICLDDWEYSVWAPLTDEVLKRHGSGFFIHDIEDMEIACGLTARKLCMACMNKSLKLSSGWGVRAYCTECGWMHRLHQFKYGREIDHRTVKHHPKADTIIIVEQWPPGPAGNVTQHRSTTVV